MQEDFFADLFGEVDATVFILRITNLRLLHLFHLTIHWRHLTVFNIIWRKIGLFLIIVLLEIYVVGVVIWGRFLLILYYVCRILLQKFVLKIICLFTNEVLSLTLLSFLDAFLTNSFNYFLRYDFTLLLLYILFWPLLLCIWLLWFLITLCFSLSLNS